MLRKHQIEEGRELTISNLEKVYFPDRGITKGEVISFYSDIARVILPHLRNRPLTLKRYPEGMDGEHFYEKNAPSHTIVGEAIRGRAQRGWFRHSLRAMQRSRAAGLGDEPANGPLATCATAPSSRCVTIRMPLKSFAKHKGCIIVIMTY